MNLKLVILTAVCALAHGVWAADALVHECRWTDEAIKPDGPRRPAPRKVTTDRS